MTLAVLAETLEAAEEEKGKDGVEIDLLLKIQGEDKAALQGARLQYEWDGEYEWCHPTKEDRGRYQKCKWHDFGEPPKDISQPKFSALDSGEWKGREVNYSVHDYVPTKRKYGDTHSIRAPGPSSPFEIWQYASDKPPTFRVVKQGYESAYFFVPKYKGSLEYYREITLKPQGKVAYWPLDEGEGKVARELTGKANPGEISGAVWVKDGGRTALKLDGEDDVITCGRDPLLQGEAITIVLWIKPAEKISTMQGLVGRAWISPYGFYTTADNGLEVALFLRGIGYQYFTQRDILRIGEWNFVGFSYGDNCLKIFHDGKKAREEKLDPEELENWMTNYPEGRPKGDKERIPLQKRDVHVDSEIRITCIRSNQPLSIGYFDGVAHFKGSMGQVMIYNHALSEEEIQGMYNDKKQDPKLEEGR